MWVPQQTPKMHDTSLGFKMGRQVSKTWKLEPHVIHGGEKKNNKIIIYDNLEGTPRAC